MRNRTCVNGLLYILIKDINHSEHHLKFSNGLMLKERILMVLFKIMMD